jgi:hypothetical protein
LTVRLRDLKRELICRYLEGKRLAEIAKPEGPADAVSVLRQLPVWYLWIPQAHGQTITAPAPRHYR